MDFDNIINKIQDSKTPVDINPEWYYHAFQGDLNSLKPILTEGLKCRKLRGIKTKDCSYNGIYYISLTKKMPSLNNNSVFKVLHASPMLIIDSDINTIKTISSYSNSFKRYLSEYLVNTKSSIRNSCWSDEYQVYKEIKPQHIIGIYFSILELLNDNNHLALTMLREIINILEQVQLDLPIIDGTDSTIIDKRIIKELKF